MKEENFQFLGLLFFGVLVLSTALFLSGSNISPTTSFAVIDLNTESTIMVLMGALSLTILSFFLKFRDRMK